MTDPSTGSWQASGSSMGQELSSCIDQIFRRAKSGRPCRMPPLDEITFPGIRGTPVKLLKRDFSDSISASSYPQAKNRMSRMDAYAASGSTSPRSLPTPDWLVEMGESIRKARIALRSQDSSKDLEGQDESGAMMSSSAFDRLWNMKYADHIKETESTSSATSAAAAAGSNLEQDQEQGQDAQPQGSQEPGASFIVQRPRRIPNIRQLTLSRLKSAGRTIPLPIDVPPPGTPSWQNPMYDTRRHRSAPRPGEHIPLDDKKRIFTTQKKPGDTSSPTPAKEVAGKKSGGSAASSTHGSPHKKTGDSGTHLSAKESIEKKSVESLSSSAHGVIRKKSHDSVTHATAQDVRGRKPRDYADQPSVEESNSSTRPSVPETSQKKSLKSVAHSSLPESSQRKLLISVACTSLQGATQKKSLNALAHPSLLQTNQKKSLDNVASLSLETSCKKLDASLGQHPIRETKHKKSHGSFAHPSIHESKAKRSDDSSCTSYSMRRLRRRRSGDSANQPSIQLASYKEVLEATSGVSNHKTKSKKSADSLAQLPPQEIGLKKPLDALSLVSGHASALKTVHEKSDDSVTIRSIKETRPKKLDASFPYPPKQKAPHKSLAIMTETSLHEIRQKSDDSFTQRATWKARPKKPDDSVLCPPVNKKSFKTKADIFVSQARLKKPGDSFAHSSVQETGKKMMAAAAAEPSHKKSSQRKYPERVAHIPIPKTSQKKSMDSMNTLSLLSLEHSSLRSWDSLTSVRPLDTSVGTGIILSRSPSCQRSQYGITINTPNRDEKHPLLCFKVLNENYSHLEMKRLLEGGTGCRLRTLDTVPGYESSDALVPGCKHHGHVVWIFSLEKLCFVDPVVQSGVEIHGQLLPVRYFTEKVKRECEANYKLKQIQDDMLRTAAAEACERKKKRRTPNSSHDNPTKVRHGRAKSVKPPKTPRAQV